MDWQLADTRLDNRADLCMNALMSNPNLSFPNIFPEPKDRVGFYRFINNENVNWENLYSAIESESFDKADSDDLALAIHDTTQVVVRPKAELIPEFRVKQGRNKPGFFAHVSLLTSMDGEKSNIYGLGGLSLWSRGNGVKEAPRWFRHVSRIEGRRSSQSTIHIMDREGDSFELFHLMLKNKYRFVVRLAHNRMVNETKKLFDVMSDKEIVCSREVLLSKRKKSPFLKAERINPARSTRLANFSIRASRVSFKNNKRKVKHGPDEISVSIVRITEEGVPIGEKPVEWYLVTGEPIETAEQIERIVDFYRRRWCIEEYFKALKTGCRLNDRLLESVDSWYNVFVLFLPVAVSLLNIRLAEDIPLQKSQIFTEVEKRILVKQAKRFKLPIQTQVDARRIVAQLGGYIQSQWPPGWQVLGRGYEKLKIFAEGAEMLGV